VRGGREGGREGGGKGEGALGALGLAPHRPWNRCSLLYGLEGGGEGVEGEGGGGVTVGALGGSNRRMSDHLLCARAALLSVLAGDHRVLWMVALRWGLGGTCCPTRPMGSPVSSPPPSRGCMARYPNVATLASSFRHLQTGPWNVLVPLVVGDGLRGKRDVAFVDANGDGLGDIVAIIRGGE
jgi:hypothetical protein